MNESSKKDVINLKDFDDKARRELSKDVYDYLSGGANDETTVKENCQAYNRILDLLGMISIN